MIFVSNKDEVMSILKSYTLLDSGNGRKLERFGPYILSRPCSQAVWKPQLPQEAWNQAHAIFSREQENKWREHIHLPEMWQIEISEIQFKLSPTDFGHLGVFPEQKDFWLWIQDILNQTKSSRESIPKVLNLFAYSGGSTLAAAKGGASVCHLDASKGMVAWARENAALNQLENAPIRWIVEDVKKFLSRELRRGTRYDAIILDPPSFGRGSKGELFKIEEDIVPLLQDCSNLLVEDPLFVLFSCHTPGFSPLVMQHLMTQMMENRKGKLEVGEMTLSSEKKVFPVPSGTYARWTKEL
jgi:23S rRNA (cytosine1962-C5)-methyltransferase